MLSLMKAFKLEFSTPCLEPGLFRSASHASSSDGRRFSTSDSSPLAFEMSGKEPPAPPPTSARARARFEPDPSSTPSTFFHRTFLLETLRKATGDFSPDNLVGQGASATVYSATLPDGSLVAVKRLNPDEGFDAKAWRAELAALGKARHRNLVPLLGVCSEGGERLLVLELFSGGSLRERLGATRASALALTWEERMNVVEGVCRGLAYLHHDITPPLLHRNVKPANVLLRGSARALEACIADFGLACLLREPEEGGAPYAAAGDNPAGGSKFMSVKRDVYSFGVLVLEVLSGRSVSEGARAAVVPVPSDSLETETVFAFENHDACSVVQGCTYIFRAAESYCDRYRRFVVQSPPSFCSSPHILF